MLKITLITSLLALSFASLASVELKSQINADTCTIKGGKVTKTTALMNGEVKFTVEKAVKFEGLEDLARRVSETSTNTRNEYFTHELVLDGKTYILNSEDSKETMVLLSVMGRLCQSI